MDSKDLPNAGAMASMSVALGMMSATFEPNPDTLKLLSDFHNDVKGHLGARQVERAVLATGAGHYLQMTMGTHM